MKRNIIFSKYLVFQYTNTTSFFYIIVVVAVPKSIPCILMAPVNIVINDLPH